MTSVGNNGKDTEILVELPRKEREVTRNTHSRGPKKKGKGSKRMPDESSSTCASTTSGRQTTATLAAEPNDSKQDTKEETTAELNTEEEKKLPAEAVKLKNEAMQALIQTRGDEEDQHFKCSRCNPQLNYQCDICCAVWRQMKVVKDKVKDETERDKLLREAERLLDTVAASADPEMNDRDRHWIHYELGTVRMIRGDVLGALDEYNSSVALDPTSISGMIGVGACHWMLATTKNELTPSERKIELQAALRTFLGAIQSIENRLRTVQVLGTGDAPKVDELPFPRRVYNQNVLSVREDLESTSIGLFVRVAKIYRLRGDTKSAALALKEGLDTLRASTELRDSSSLEIELRTQLGSVYESVKKYALAAQQYGTVLKNLDPDHEHARRGYDRVKDRDEAPAGGGRDAVTRREER